jgi:hypothetical protein
MESSIKTAIKFMHTCIHSGMISNYYNHSSMALLFLPFVSMLIPRAYKLAIVSEEERRTREHGNKTN